MGVLVGEDEAVEGQGGIGRPRGRRPTVPCTALPSNGVEGHCIALLVGLVLVGGVIGINDSIVLIEYHR